MKRFLSLLSIMLSGCAGSYVVYGDSEMKPFDSLHTVPDRPAKRPATFYQEKEATLRSHHATLTKIHESERKAQGLQVINPCQKGGTSSR